MHRYTRYSLIQRVACLDDDVLIATSFEGAPVSREHGGPARVIVPKLYAWKGAEFVKAITFLAEDKLGFWEVRGYSNTADPRTEDRYARKRRPSGSCLDPLIFKGRRVFQHENELGSGPHHAEIQRIEARPRTALTLSRLEGLLPNLIPSEIPEVGACLQEILRHFGTDYRLQAGSCSWRKHRTWFGQHALETCPHFYP